MQLAADAATASASTPTAWQLPDWLSSPLQQLMQQQPSPVADALDSEQPAAETAAHSTRGRRARRRSRGATTQQQQQQQQQEQDHISSSSSGTSCFSAAALAEMLNPANCFPMLLQPPPLPAAAAPDGSCQEECAAQTALVTGSMQLRRPQQLLTVGCRHWSSLLRIRVYDYALYVDGQQVRVLGGAD
jgi:hypothetical protein